jgi:hypothetical protein
MILDQSYYRRRRRQHAKRRRSTATSDRTCNHDAKCRERLAAERAGIYCVRRRCNDDDLESAPRRLATEMPHRVYDG